MKRRDIILIVSVAVITGILSLLISGVIFSVPKNRSSKVPTADIVPTALPDIKNDSSYKAFLNTNALDPAQPVQVGNTQNSTPFNSNAQQ